jgi:hypothetical protein
MTLQFSIIKNNENIQFETGDDLFLLFVQTWGL